MTALGRPLGRAVALVIGGVALLALAGCTQTKFVANLAKEMEPEQSYPGAYKVGDPYRIDGVWYYPAEDDDYVEIGVASWYGPQFDGNRTANGELFDMDQVSAAHRTLPMPSLVQVTNLENGRSMKVRINDRGPFARGRIIDVSRRTAELLGFADQGTARVRVALLVAESRELKLAVLDGYESPEEQAQLAAVAPPGVNSDTARGMAPAPQPTPAVAIAPAEQVLIAPPMATRLYVQAGAFTKAENAERLRGSLDRLGRTEVRPVTVDGQRFYRVRVGPVPSVEHADRVLDRVVASGYPQARLVVEAAP